MNRQKDTSFFLMLAAHERGHQVFFFDQDSLSLAKGEVVAELFEVSSFTDWPEKSVEELCQDVQLSQMDLVFIRKDPPFDRRYFYTTLLLDCLPASVKVVNRPQALRDHNEKLAALPFAEFCPETLVSSSFEQIENFASEHQKVVIKPLDGFGGRGIHIIDAQEWHRGLHAQVTAGRQEKVMVQRFVEEAELGDKRVLLFQGEPLGAILRVASQPGQLNNLDQGGQAKSATLTARDLEVCARLKPFLQAQGLDFVGIDLLGPYLTEVNVTSPTGLQELSRFEKRDFHHQIIAAYE